MSKNEKKDELIIRVLRYGPYLISGNVPLKKEIIVTDEKGESVAYKSGEEYPAREQYALCRCGHSNTMPYCDGTHTVIDFNGAETASREPYMKQAHTIEGPQLLLMDVQELCAYARFCHPGGKVWNLTRGSDDPKARDLAIREAELCPSGRLIAREIKSKKPYEPDFEKSISLIQDPSLGVSGPIWAKGGIPIESSDGFQYEVRNRVTLCRCGESSNKPFCDGSHVSCHFNDET